MRAPERFIERGGKQAGFGVGRQRGLYFRQNADCFAIENRLVLIGLFGVRRKMAVREARAQIEHRVEGFAIMVRETRKPGQTGRVEPIVEKKIKGRATDKWHQMTPAPPSTTRIWPLI